MCAWAKASSARAIYEVSHATLAERWPGSSAELQGAKAEIADKMVREIAARLRSSTTWA
jgi:excinuclease ABC subunit A